MKFFSLMHAACLLVALVALADAIQSQTNVQNANVGVAHPAVATAPLNVKTTHAPAASIAHDAVKAAGSHVVGPASVAPAPAYPAAAKAPVVQPVAHNAVKPPVVHAQTSTHPTVSATAVTKAPGAIPVAPATPSQPAHKTTTAALTQAVASSTSVTHMTATPSVAHKVDVKPTVPTQPIVAQHPVITSNSSSTAAVKLGHYFDPICTQLDKLQARHMFKIQSQLKSFVEKVSCSAMLDIKAKTIGKY